MTGLCRDQRTAPTLRQAQSDRRDVAKPPRSENRSFDSAQDDTELRVKQHLSLFLSLRNFSQRNSFDEQNLKS